MDKLKIACTSTLTLMAVVVCCFLTVDIAAQIKPPGFEREVQEMEARKRTNILDRDSVMVVDTVTLFDPTTYEEMMRIVSSNMSWRDYMTLRLGLNQPDMLLNGAPLKLTDPRTYETLTIQWNSGAMKLDTIPQR